MTALTRSPSNKDILQSTKFRLNFARLSGLTYFCQTANLPGISLTEVLYPTPFVDLYVPGEKAIYDTLNVTMIIDEDLANWKQIHDWIRGMTFPKEFEEYLGLARQSPVVANRLGKQPPQYSDGSMTIYTNKNNPNIRIKFKDLFPTTLGTIMFSTLDSAENIITCDASFRFSYYDLETI